MVSLVSQYAVFLISSASVSLINGLYILRHRLGLRAKVGSILIFSGVLWSFGYGLELILVDFQTKILLNKIQYISIVTLGPTMLIYTMISTGRENWANLRNAVLLFVVPAASLLLIFTNERHGLIWPQITLTGSYPSILLENFGKAYGLISGYNYLTLLAGCLLSAQILIRARHLYSRQGTVLLVGMIIPWVWSNVTMFKLYSFDIDITPIMFNFMCIVVTIINPTRLHLSDIVPLAREVILERMSDGVIVLDEMDRVIDLNPSAQRLIGLPRDGIIGGVLGEVWDTWHKYRSSNDEWERDELVLVEGEDVRIFDTNVSPIVDWRGRVHSRVVVLHDITPYKETEEELRSYSEQLELLVEEKTRRLREAERLAAIGELAAMVGHDLRNPLTSISGATYYLRRRMGDSPDEKINQMLEIIEDGIGYSDKIIRDLLDYSREIRLETCVTSPKFLVRDALSLVQVPENIVLTDQTEEQPQMWVDAQKMRRVFVNIVTNALDAMPEGGSLTIKSRSDAGKVEISFEDTGRGIPDELREKIWKPLFTTKARGMGFGLAICRRIVEAHGGTITLRSSEGEGSTFTVALPTRYTEEKNPTIDAPEALIEGT